MIHLNDYVERIGYWFNNTRETAFWERNVGRIVETYVNISRAFSHLKLSTAN